MTKDEIIQALNLDLKGEHAAIIQYLTHAYAMGEGEMACEIEAIAREEMRHLDLLAETIVGLGGVPTLERGLMRMGGNSVSEWMRLDVLQEEDALDLYRQHIEAIDDPKIKRLLRRILSDEESHHGDFRHFIDKALKEGARDLRGTHNDRVVQTLGWGIEHEYTVILQYLFQSYLTTSEEASRELEDQAVNEMQHLGWLAEKVVGMSATPRIEYSEVEQTIDTADMLRADIKIEKEVAATYDQAAGEIEDPALKALLIRIRDHELYHAEVFSDLLEQQGS